MARRRQHSAEYFARLRYQSYRSQPPFQNLDEYLVLTQPPEPAAPSPPPQPSPVEGEGAQPRKPRCTKQEKLRRLDAFASWLKQDAPMEQIFAAAKRSFNLGRRSAQLYVREVKKRWAEAAQKEDYVAHLWKSKLQYETGVNETLRALQATDDPKVKANLLRVNLAYLKAKDECLATLQLHRRKSRRDQSPDSLRARQDRENMVVMPLGELLERADNMRREWRAEYFNEFARANGLFPPDPKFVNGELVYPPDDPNRKRAVDVSVLPDSPPAGWGVEWQKRAEEKAKEELKKELGFGDEL